MRILGFMKHWPKLDQEVFTTFRYPRLDKDWEIGEEVKVVIKPRCKGGGEILGIARIIGKEQKELDSSFSDVAPLVTDTEAIADGFEDVAGMVSWMEKTYGLDYISLMNKLTLRKLGKNR